VRTVISSRGTDRPLPPRGDDVIATLPETFRASQVDYLPNSMAWYDDELVASVDCWGDRRLGQFRDDTWTELEGPPGCMRVPRIGDDGALAAFCHAPSSDFGRMSLRHNGNWRPVGEPIEEGAICDWNGVAVTRRNLGDAVAWGPDAVRIEARSSGDGRRAIRFGSTSELAVPNGATVHQIVPSPDRSLALITMRLGADFRSVVCSTLSGAVVSPTQLREPVTRVAAWRDDGHIVLVRESWPGQTPFVWAWKDSRVDEMWERGDVGVVRSLALRPSTETMYAATATGGSPRSIHVVDDEPRHAELVQIRTVQRGAQPIPCIVLEPDGPACGTAFYFPGGPHEPIWAEYSSGLAANGWRVVRVNTRSSGLRERSLRAKAPFVFGRDDVADAMTAIDELAVGPIVTLGMSYGAYVGALAGEQQPRCVGIASLSGFLSAADLRHTRHAGVADFAATHLHHAHNYEPQVRAKQYFIAHGTEDPRVPFSAMARYAGPDVMLIGLDAEGHAIHTDRAARLAYPPLFDWLGELVI